MEKYFYIVEGTCVGKYADSISMCVGEADRV
jgi:hypothetical protein